jgi:hypothetical protein
MPACTQHICAEVSAHRAQSSRCDIRSGACNRQARLQVFSVTRPPLLDVQLCTTALQEFIASAQPAAAAPKKPAPKAPRASAASPAVQPGRSTRPAPSPLPAGARPHAAEQAVVAESAQPNATPPNTQTPSSSARSAEASVAARPAQPQPQPQPALRAAAAPSAPQVTQPEMHGGGRASEGASKGSEHASAAPTAVFGGFGDDGNDSEESYTDEAW